MSDGTLGPGGRPRTLVDVLRWRAAADGDAPLYTFLADGEDVEQTFTFADLDAQARAIGAALQARRLAGERVLLLYPPGLEYAGGFFGCLYAGAIPVPAYPPDPLRLARTVPRLRALMADARAAAVATSALVVTMRDAVVAEAPDVGALDWIATDGIPATAADDWRMPDVGGESIAFLQYTSGSTALPKGVVLTHANLLENQRMLVEIFGGRPDDRVFGWLPTYHDMGLIGNMLYPVWTGCPLTFISPVDFLQRPLRWLAGIARHRCTISGGPNFAYDLCVRKTTPAQRAALDLRSWTVAFSGSETVRADTLARFAEAFAPSGFDARAVLPCYGLAEGTLCVSGKRRAHAPFVEAFSREALAAGRATPPADDETPHPFVSSGAAAQDTAIVIVDPDSRVECDDGEIGEIWVAGPAVAAGYWDCAEETRETFGAHTAGHRGPFLRTGDLGFLHAGELFVTGRLKDLVIIRGRNLAPPDIERTIERCHERLRAGCGAVFAISTDDGEGLAVVHETDADDGTVLDDAVRCIERTVTDEHGVRPAVIVLIAPRTLPKTSSGKTQRWVCRREFEGGRLATVREWRAPSDVDVPATAAAGAEPALRAWLVAQVAAELGMPAADVDVQAPFSSFGIDSVRAVGLSGELEDRVGRRLPATLLYEYPTIAALAAHLAGTIEVRDDEGAARDPAEPIAIVGIGCRFPGASDPDELWTLLAEGRDAIGPVPESRWDAEAFYDRDPGRRGTANTRWGGFVADVDRFDAQFFRISPREAVRMDPQQRLLLEVAWEALEDAATLPAALAGTRTGIFVGVSTSDYGNVQLADPAGIDDAYCGTGVALSIAANRLSYFLDVHGPSLAVDTACSSSLVAVHLAVRSLRQGECTLALAGGVNAILSPSLAINFSKAGLMAADGRCKPFDARADGYVRGEGCGVVVLKRLSDAVAAGDRVYAVIRGSAVNHDGRTNGLMAPSRRAQEAVLRAAYRDAGLPPQAVQYVEAHGTGTLLGDPIEARALGQVVGAGRSPDEPCLVGSIKSNIGHLEPAAGVAGLVKTALALAHRAIPPSVHYQEPNPHIAFADLGLRVADALAPWPSADGPATAGVSSFGFGGTNAHVVLEAAPAAAPDAAATATDGVLVPLSAHDEPALRSVAATWASWLRALDPTALRDVAATACRRRTHHPHRLAVVGRTPSELAAQLETVGSAQRRTAVPMGVAHEGRRIGFVFSGQGTQWPGMGRELWAKEPSFRDAVTAVAIEVERQADLDLREIFDPKSPLAGRLDETGVAQPALFAVQVGLAALWRAWGIEPAAVVGHSVGEVAAAFVAGALDLSSAVRVVTRRGALMESTRGGGRMLAVELDADAARPWLGDVGDDVVVAAVNGPRAIVLSGTAATLTAIAARLEREGVAARWLKVPYAFHGPQMAEAADALGIALADLVPGDETLALYSTVTGMRHPGRSWDAAYWVRNVRQPVQLLAAFRAMLADGVDAVVEVGPHPALIVPMRDALAADERLDVPVVSSLRRDREERIALLEGAAALHVAGATIRWDAVVGPGTRVVALPRYPWQRESFWFAGASVASPTAARPGGHPLLGGALRPAGIAGHVCWERALDLSATTWLADHRIGDVVLLPATAHLEIGLAAGAELWGHGPHAIEDARFTRPIVLGAEPIPLQVDATDHGDGTATVVVYARPAAVTADAPWARHATLRMRRAADTDSPPPPALEVGAIQARCDVSWSGPDHYTALARHGLAYGPAFAAVERGWRGAGEALGQVGVPPALADASERYVVHPALLDACWHVIGAAVSGDDAPDALYIPAGVDRLQAFGDLARVAWSHVRARRSGDAIVADLTVADADGAVLLAATGVRLERLAPDAARPIEPHVVTWEPQDRPPQAVTSSGWWLIVADDRATGTALARSLEDAGERTVVVRPAGEFRQIADGEYEVAPGVAGDVARVVQTATNGGAPCRGAVYVPALAGSSGPAAAAADATATLVALVQALVQSAAAGTTRLWVLTRGAEAVAADDPITLEHAPLAGALRAVAHEHPELRCTQLDVPVDEATLEALSAELLGESPEPAVAFRAGTRHVRRLARAVADARSEHAAGDTVPFHLTWSDTGAPGWCATTPRALRASDVRLRVHVAAVADPAALRATSRDVPPSEPALVCAGTVLACGAGVTATRPGDDVVAFVTGTLASVATADAALVAPRPSGLAAADTSRVLASMLARRALDVADVAAGDRVLVSDAGGGVGLAALALARRCGARTIAVVGADPDDAARARALGATVLDGRTAPDVVDDVGRWSDGAGVDVVIGSAPADVLAAVLRPTGRLVETSDAPAHHAPANVACHRVDLAALHARRPDLVAALFAQAVIDVARGDVPSWIAAAVAASEIPTALPARTVNGSFPIAVDFDDPAVRVRVGADGAIALRDDATYLVTGGLGALGLVMAQWLADHGARHLVLVGRRPPSPDAEAAVTALRARDVDVTVAAADVAQEADVARVLDGIARTPWPLRGVVHAAGVLDDALVFNLDRARVANVLRPKVDGAWHLDRLTRGTALDWFVLFSSAAAMIGSPGQASYCAANAFLDALAHARRHAGLPALSVAWGPWQDLGMAARGGIAPLRLAGIEPIERDAALRGLTAVWTQSSPHVALMRLDLARLCEAMPRAREWPLLAGLTAGLAAAPERESAIRLAIEAAMPGVARRNLLERYLREQLADVLHVDPERVGAQTSLAALGVDSLMTVELRNRLEASLGVTLSATMAFNYPTVAAIAGHLGTLMGLPLDAPRRAAPVATPAPAESADVDAVMALSEEEVERLLNERLADLREEATP
jgi:acyl transferase domain-containing protein/acyl-CoA synthetase (AMP-forming)/AMP-acid ligase II/NADPH:quinone reductase-like Zn-dependent oxidoreductase/acyl carrier protein